MDLEFVRPQPVGRRRAEAPGHQSGTRARLTRGFDVDPRIADHQRLLRTRVDLRAERVEAARIGLARLLAVAADHVDEEIEQIEVIEDLQRRAPWLVGQHRELRAPQQFAERFGNAGIRLRMRDEMTLVDFDEARQRLVDRRVDFGGGQHARNQQARAFADHRHYRVDGERRGAVLAEQFVRGIGDVAPGIYQSTVEVKGNESDHLSFAAC